MSKQDSSSADAASELLRLTPRPIWVVTAGHGVRRGGLIATFVLQASIDPQRPTVVVGLAPNHFTTELVEASGQVGLHLITRQHIDRVWRFAIGSGRDRDKLAGVPLLPSPTDVPILADCLSWFHCKILHRYSAGDRTFFWADVIAADKRGDGEPLLERDALELASAEQRAALKADMLADIALQRPLAEEWRKLISSGGSATS
jgi:flavin reductase (DIM6/NTAB) family NADH-FMN oxidoreductase RutF